MVRALKDSAKFVSQDPNEPFPVIETDNVYIVDIAITQKHGVHYKTFTPQKLMDRSSQTLFGVIVIS